MRRSFPDLTPLPGDVPGWFETFGHTFTRVLPSAEIPAYLADVREQLPSPALLFSATKLLVDSSRAGGIS